MALVKMIPVLIILSCPLLLFRHLLHLIRRQNCGLITEQRKAQVFLTNQTTAVYKQLANLVTQQTPPKDINKLTMLEIVDFMKKQFDPKLFIVRERFKFWSDMQRKPGETLQKLAARTRQDAATCDFPSIEDPQDEALRQIHMLCQQRSCLKGSL